MLTDPLLFGTLALAILFPGRYALHCLLPSWRRPPLGPAGSVQRPHTHVTSYVWAMQDLDAHPFKPKEQR